MRGIICIAAKWSCVISRGSAPHPGPPGTSQVGVRKEASEQQRQESSVNMDSVRTLVSQTLASRKPALR